MLRRGRLYSEILERRIYYIQRISLTYLKYISTILYSSAVRYGYHMILWYNVA